MKSKWRNLNRRSQLAIIIAGAAIVLFGANLTAAPKKAAPKAKVNAPAPEPFLGAANAPVTLIEYGSMTCGHCAAFARDDFPIIKTRYIDTGKVKFVFRTLPTPPHQLSMGMQIIADCSGPKRFEVIESFFHMQNSIFAASESPRGVLPKLLEVARYNGGISDEAAKQCLANEANAQRIANIAQSGIDRYKLESTPTFVIDNRRATSVIVSPDAAKLSAAIDKALLPSATTRPKRP